MTLARDTRPNRFDSALDLVSEDISHCLRVHVQKLRDLIQFWDEISQGARLPLWHPVARGNAGRRQT